MSIDDFKEVQKKDVKNSKGFYLFSLVWVIVAIVWLFNGGAEDGAWWMFGVGAGLLLVVNPIANWLTRNE